MNTDIKIESNKFIDKHCSRKRFDESRLLCKISNEINEDLKLPRKHIKLINDFYSALTLEERNKVIDKIINDDSFFQRNADLLYRYTDGLNLLKPDFDRVTIGYNTSDKVASEINNQLRRGNIPDGFILAPCKIRSHYIHTGIMKSHSGNGIRIFLKKKHNKSRIRNIKIDLSPSYFTDEELSIFFTWFNKQLGKERKKAIKNSIITLMENGLQLHHIFSPLIVHRNIIGKEEKYNWQIWGKPQDFYQASYDSFNSECGGNIVNKIYCPVSKLFNKIFSKRTFDEADARIVMENISHATRLESVYTYSLENNAKEYSLLELEHVPSYLNQFELVAPDSLIKMSSVDKILLMKKRIVNCESRSVVMTSSCVESKRIEMLKRYKTIFLS